MHKTVYIEKDEEITSIVSKIKKEESKDIFLVVPKGALLSQGMINLKLLKKEADRLEKELFIITSDEQAKKIIAKVGLKIREIPKTPEERKEAVADLFAGQASEEAIDVLDKNENAVREIGSSSFFEKKELGEPKRQEIAEERVSAKEFKSEDLRAALYSKNKGKQGTSFEESDFGAFQQKKQRETVFFDKEAVAKTPAAFSADRVVGTQHLKIRNDGAPAPVRPAYPERKKVFQAENFRQAEDFFSEKKEGAVPLKRNFFQDNQEKTVFQKQQARVETKRPGKAKWFLAIVGLLFLFAFTGWGYWSWPKVSVKIYPRGVKVDGEVLTKIFSNQDYIPAVGDQVKGAYHELEVEKTVEMNSSGVGSGSIEGKAKGKVVILNKYSGTSQSLIATTRLLSKDGKLFRLADNVIVPGMEGETAGRIEATVVADKAGEEFNIGASQFAIEGFKGTPKYEKFEVTSSEAMKGGGAGDGSDDKKIVLQKDIDAARIKAMDELGKSLASLVEEKIGSGQKYFLDSAGKEIIDAFSDVRINEEGEKFNYTVKEKIKLISFEEKDLKELVYEKIIQEVGEEYNLEKEKILFSYDKPIIDWEKKEMEVAVSYDGFILPKLDKGAIKNELLGKNEEEIKEILVKNQQLEKAELEYYPAWAGRWPAIERNFSIVDGEK